MKLYERKAKAVIGRFKRRKINFAACIAALDAALASYIPALTGDQLPHLRAVMLANNEIVMKEMEQRATMRPDARGKP
jgi:hypothetical protein